jgi:hypothetical protein
LAILGFLFSSPHSEGKNMGVAIFLTLGSWRSPKHSKILENVYCPFSDL